MKTKNILAIILLTIVSACASLPEHIVVSPELINYSKNVYSNQSIKLNIIDQRTGSQVVQIMQNDEPAKLLSSQNSLSNIITQALSPVMRKQGLTLDNFSNINVDIVIDTALINVQQNFIKYTAKNTIILKAIIVNADNRFSKTFNISGTSNGPLTADIAVLERDFNHQLASVLVRIANDIEIQNAINVTSE